MVSEGGYEDEWQEGDDWNESYEGYWAEDTTGMKAIGPLMICTILMSMDTSRRKEKEKERKARKARMMMAKEEN